MSDSNKQFKPDRLPDYSKQEIIKEIRRVILDECGGIVPSRDRFDELARVSRPTIAKRFGTYSEAIQQAGFLKHRQDPRPIITTEQVKTDLFQILNKSDGFCFTQEFYEANGGTYCVEVVKARLGSHNWKSVLEAIGAKEKPRIAHTVVSDYAQRRNLIENLTETELFKEIERVWNEKVKRPTYHEFKGASQYGISVYETRYGSWTSAIEAFCKANDVLVQGRAGTQPTKDILLNELRSVQLKQQGAILTYDSYKANGGTYSSSVFKNLFGSWTAAVNIVGSISGEQARYSRDDLFNEIQRLWEQFGRQPKQEEMWKKGKISPKCYARTFGSWTRAIHAFCEDRNDIPALTETPELPSCGEDVVESVTIEAPIDIPCKNPALIIIEHNTGRTVSPKLRFKVLQRDNFTCKACGRSPANVLGLELHVDHIVAYSNGGETVLDNLQALCKECNFGKSNRSMD